MHISTFKDVLENCVTTIKPLVYALQPGKETSLHQTYEALAKLLCRSRTSNERLEELMLIACEKDITDEVRLHSVATLWARLKVRRVTKTGKFESLKIIVDFEYMYLVFLFSLTLKYYCFCVDNYDIVLKRSRHAEDTSNVESETESPGQQKRKRVFRFSPGYAESSDLDDGKLLYI